MTREKAKKIMRTLTSLIENIVDKYLDNIYKIVTKYLINDISTEEAIKEIEDIFYQVFEEVYKIVSQVIKKNYKKVSAFDVNNILDLTYHTDGKTLEERIIDYLEQNIPKLKLLDKLYNLLLNESRIIESGVIKGKLQKTASLLVIECGDNDCNSECVEYAGEYPADEDIPLPPYHPGCACEYYYLETNDEDDIQDLDLDIEDIEIL